MPTTDLTDPATPEIDRAHAVSEKIIPTKRENRPGRRGGFRLVAVLALGFRL